MHTAILLGVGIVLARLRDLDMLPRGVRLIFQPAEETSPGGALDAIEGGVLHDLTEIYALHCDPRTDVGQIALKVGPITSAVDQVNITLSGTGGHTSRPQLTQDIIGALGALATMTQLLLSRRIDPRSGVSLMWGSMHSGSVANAIPRTGEIVGTLRALDAAGWQLAKQLIPELAAEIVKPFGVEVDVAVTDGVPPAVNHRARRTPTDPSSRRDARTGFRDRRPSSPSVGRTSPGCCSRFPVPWGVLAYEPQVRSALTFTSQPSSWTRGASRSASKFSLRWRPPSSAARFNRSCEVGGSPQTASLLRIPFGK